LRNPVRARICTVYFLDISTADYLIETIKSVFLCLRIWTTWLTKTRSWFVLLTLIWLIPLDETSRSGYFFYMLICLHSPSFTFRFYCPLNTVQLLLKEFDDFTSAKILIIQMNHLCLVALFIHIWLFMAFKRDIYFFLFLTASKWFKLTQYLLIPKFWDYVRKKWQIKKNIPSNFLWLIKVMTK
jgi:hypothetical protein